MNPYYTALASKISSTIDTASFSESSGCGIAKYALNTNYDNKGGNIAYTCYIRKGNAANYYPLFANTTSELVKTLLSFLSDANGLSLYDANGTTGSGGVPAINLRDEIEKGTVIIDWNTDRNLTKESFKNLANWYIEIFNDLISFMIRRGITTPSSNFYNKFMDLFCNKSDKNKVYAHSVYTLMLPAIINVLSRAGICEGAHNYMGYVSKSSRVVPYKANDGRVWWGKKITDTTYKKETRTLGETEIRRKINNTMISGNYCNPFSYTSKEGGIRNNYPLAVHPAPAYTDLYTPPFTVDNYKNNKEALLSKTYLTVEGDYVETVSATWRPLIMSDFKETTQPRMFYKCNSGLKKTTEYEGDGKCFAIKKTGTGSKTDFDDYSPEGLSNASYNKYYTFDTGINVGQRYNIPSNSCIDIVEPLNNSTWAEFINNLASSGKSRRQLISKLPSGVKTKEYPQSYTQRYEEIESATLFTCAFDVFYIHPATIRYWMYMLNTPESMTYIASEISKAITPEMVLMHHISSMFNGYVKGSFGMWSLPIGPPCLRPISQYVLPAKNYLASYEVVDNCVKTKTVETKTYLQYSLENIIKNSTVSTISDKTTFSLIVPGNGYNLFDLVGYSNKSSINAETLSATIEDSGSGENSVSDISKCKIVVRFAPIDTKLQSSYTEIGQIFVPVFKFTAEGNNFKIQFNDCQRDISSSKLASSKQLLNNKAYVYMSKSTSNNSGTYSIENFASQKDSSGKITPYFVLKFNANEIKDKPAVIKKIVYD
jgi:hypothetical protein